MWQAATGIQAGSEPPGQALQVRVAALHDEDASPTPGPSFTGKDPPSQRRNTAGKHAGDRDAAPWCRLGHCSPPPLADPGSSLPEAPQLTLVRAARPGCPRTGYSLTCLHPLRLQHFESTSRTGPRADPPRAQQALVGPQHPRTAGGEYVGVSARAPLGCTRGGKHAHVRERSGSHQSLGIRHAA